MIYCEFWLCVPLHIDRNAPSVEILSLMQRSSKNETNVLIVMKHIAYEWFGFVEGCSTHANTHHCFGTQNDIASSFLKKLDAQTSLARNTKDKELCANRTPRCRKWHEVEDEFLGRVYLDLARRKSDHSALLQEEQKECTFRPVICKGSQKVHTCPVYLNVHVFFPLNIQAKVDTFQTRLTRDLQQQKHKGRTEALK